VEVMRDHEDWLREEQELCRGGEHAVEDQQQQEQHGRNDNMRPPPPPLEYNAHITTNDHDAYVASFEHNDESSSDVDHAGLEADNVKLLAHELVVLDDRGKSWAEEMENEGEYMTKGEYINTGYSAPPSSTSWYKPPTPTLDYAPPWTHYAPSRTRYRPPGTRYTSRNPPYHPRTHPQPARKRPFETRRSHVTATRRVHFRYTLVPTTTSNIGLCASLDPLRTPPHSIRTPPHLLHAPPSPIPPPPPPSTETTPLFQKPNQSRDRNATRERNAT
jgi:hypothetical protein